MVRCVDTDVLEDNESQEQLDDENDIDHELDHNHHDDIDDDHNHEDDIDDDHDHEEEDEDSPNFDCFDFVYPLRVEMPDGTILSADGESALFEQIEQWYTDHPDTVADWTYVWPIQVAKENVDALITVHSWEELHSLCD